MGFEDELRRSLATRAADVTPDPALFSRVQARIRRGRAFRFALAAAAGALAIAGVAVAAPTMMDRRVEFAPGPVGDQLPSEATPAATPTSGPVAAVPRALVFTDGKAVYSATPQGKPDVLIASGCPEGGTCDYEPTNHVTAGPRTPTPGAQVTVVSERGCGGLHYAGGEVPRGGDTCPTSATFSPNGSHLAWVSAGSAEGEWFLSVDDWSAEGPLGDEVSFAIPITDAENVTVDDWVWTQADTDPFPEGRLVLRARRDGIVSVFLLPVQGQPDGAVAVSLKATAAPASNGYTPLVFAFGGNDVSYTLEARLAPDGPTDARIVRRTGSSVDGELAVAPELFTRNNFDEFSLWMSAADDTLLYGSAATEQAWAVDWPGGEPTAASAVDMGKPIIHADLVPAAFGGAPEAPATQAATEAPSDAPPAMVEVQVHFTQEGGECGEDVAPYPRMVRGPGVLRGALEELLEGPDRAEVAAGASSIFSEETAETLDGVTIGGNGVAVVDFTADFTDTVISASCASSAAFTQLDATVRQFPSVAEVVYSLDGSIDSFYGAYEAVTPPHRPGIPLPVTRTQQAISDAVTSARQDNDWEELRRLSSQTSCTASDQKEPCVPYWKDQEANGEDPLGVLDELLDQPATKHPDADMWVWPRSWATSGDDAGPRVGIDPSGAWRYYVQAGQG